MPILEVRDLTKYYGALHVLDCVSFKLEAGNRVGLVGLNGTGKTTLLNIIEGREDYDSGQISLQSGARLGYLTQEPEFTPGLTVEEEMLEVFSDLRCTGEELTELESRMSQAETGAHDALQTLMERYSALRERFERGGGYGYRARVRSVLSGLGLSAEFWVRPTARLSGGEKTRAALARLLLTGPELLMLDEPTNYLDMAAIEWLERFLRDYPGTVLLVSHDRYFLDRVVTGILELANRKITVYSGNYSEYGRQRQAAIEAWKKAYALQQKELQRQEKLIRESAATEKAKREAKSRQKRLDMVERIERPPDDPHNMRLQFDAGMRSGHKVLEIEGLSKSFGDRGLLKGVTLRIEAGDKVALLGPNGAGKTTLIRILLGQEPADGGRIRWGHGVISGYYAQEDPDVNLSGTPFEEIVAQRGMDNLAARSHLARFLFRGEDVFKRNEDLSGGERRRLALAKLVLTRANFLVLDEPTNHLDLSAIEAIEEALADYSGTLLFVSHDRYFVNRVATRLLILEPGGTMRTFEGTYEQYQEACARESTPAVTDQPRAGRVPRPRKVSRRVLEELESVESEIQRLEDRRRVIAGLLCNPDVYADYQEAARLTDEDGEAVRRIEVLYERWSELNAIIDETGAQNQPEEART